MNRDERFISHKIFENMIYKAEGMHFQQLFEAIMSRFKENFKTVKPWGAAGDKKNDGFFEVTGVFYQVYGPEDIKKSKTILEACNKLKNDIDGLISNWSESHQITEVYFVINDKYKGSPPDLLQSLAKIRKKHAKIKIDILTAKDLEDTLFKLSDDHIIDIIGLIPSPKSISNIKYQTMNDVIVHLTHNMQPVKFDEDYDRKEFDEKIKINSLKKAKPLLEQAQYQIGELENFFQKNAQFVVTNVRDKFLELYNEAKDIPQEDMSEKGDAIFFYILQNAFPAKSKNEQDCVLVLIAYFFEACDLFEKENQDTI